MGPSCPELPDMTASSKDATPTQKTAAARGRVCFFSFISSFLVAEGPIAVGWQGIVLNQVVQGTLLQLLTAEL